MCPLGPASRTVPAVPRVLLRCSELRQSQAQEAIAKRRGAEARPRWRRQLPQRRDLETKSRGRNPQGPPGRGLSPPAQRPRRTEPPAFRAGIAEQKQCGRLAGRLRLQPARAVAQRPEGTAGRRPQQTLRTGERAGHHPPSRSISPEAATTTASSWALQVTKTKLRGVAPEPGRNRALDGAVSRPLGHSLTPGDALSLTPLPGAGRTLQAPSSSGRAPRANAATWHSQCFRCNNTRFVSLSPRVSPHVCLVLCCGFKCPLWSQASTHTSQVAAPVALLPLSGLGGQGARVPGSPLCSRLSRTRVVSRVSPKGHRAQPSSPGGSSGPQSCAMTWAAPGAPRLAPASLSPTDPSCEAAGPVYRGGWGSRRAQAPQGRGDAG